MADDGKDSDCEDDDEQIIEQRVERVQRDQQDAGDAENVVADDDEKVELLWYHKVKPVVDHIRKKSLELIFILGTFLALDEMMIRFCGRSIETHRIKNKPIKEGFKFFVLATIHGFVVNFCPDGHTAAKKEKEQKNDYTNDDKYGKIGSMILYLAQSILDMKKKQEDRIRRSDIRTKTRSQVNRDTVEDFELCSNKFIIAMDNYFTRPKVIHKLRLLGIGVVVTAKYQQGWPPVALKQVDDQKSHFNNFFGL